MNTQLPSAYGWHDWEAIPLDDGRIFYRSRRIGESGAAVNVYTGPRGRLTILAERNMRFRGCISVDEARHLVESWPPRDRRGR